MSEFEQFDWDDLRFFLAVSRAGSVNRASADLGVSHTTALRRVKTLEARLGTRLFDRTRAGYGMTDAASAIVGHAEAIEAEVIALRRRVDGLDQRLAGVVRLTAPQEVVGRLLVPALPEFRRRCPAVELVFMETMATLDLDAREAELAVRVTRRPPEDLVGRQVHPVVQGVYRLRSSDTTDLLLYRREERRGWAARYPDARVALRTDSPTTMLRAVLAGVGIARLPCYLAGDEPRLVRLGPLLEPDGWGLWVLTHPDVRSSARVRACRDWVTDVLRRQSALILGEGSEQA